MMKTMMMQMFSKEVEGRKRTSLRESEVAGVKWRRG